MTVLEIQVVEGWIGEAVVIVAFGFFGSFYRFRPVGWVLYSCYIALGAALTSALVYGVCASGGVPSLCPEPGFSPVFGLLSGALIMFAFIGAPPAIELLGVGAGQATWGVIIIIVSYTFGRIAFKEANRDDALAYTGLASLIVGILTAALAGDISHMLGFGQGGKEEEEDDLDYYTSLNAGAPHDKDEGEEIVHPHRRPLRDTLAGIAVAICIGCSGAFTLVPTRYLAPNLRGLAYQPSFGFGAGLLALVSLGVRYALRRWIGEDVVDARARLKDGPMWSRLLAGVAPKGVRPYCGRSNVWYLDALNGMACGLVWCIGNAGGLVGINNLAFSVAFPLSQAGIAVGGIVGIVAFNEVPGTVARIIFAVGLALLLAGSFLLGYYGPKR